MYFRSDYQQPQTCLTQLQSSLVEKKKYFGKVPGHRLRCHILVQMSFAQLELLKIEY